MLCFVGYAILLTCVQLSVGCFKTIECIHGIWYRLISQYSTVLAYLRKVISETRLVN